MLLYFITTMHQDKFLVHVIPGYLTNEGGFDSDSFFSKCQAKAQLQQSLAVITNSSAERKPSYGTHPSLWLLRVVFSLLHSCGHLIHGCDDDATGLAQTLVEIYTLGAVDLSTRTEHNQMGNDL